MSISNFKEPAVSALLEQNVVCLRLIQTCDQKTFFAKPVAAWQKWVPELSGIVKAAEIGSSADAGVDNELV